MIIYELNPQIVCGKPKYRIDIFKNGDDLRYKCFDYSEKKFVENRKLSKEDMIKFLKRFKVKYVIKVFQQSLFNDLLNVATL